MNKPDFEIKLRLAARLESEREGRDALAELSELNALGGVGTFHEFSALDKKVRGFSRPRRRALRYGSLAAGLILVVLLSVMRPLWQASPPPLYPGDTATAPDSLPGGTPADTRLIPLSFTLPERMTVASAELDNGESVYHLEDAARDDVVLKLRREPEAESFEGLSPFELDGITAYSVSTPDYKLVAFNKDGVRYELSCRYELSTLVELSEKII